MVWHGRRSGRPHSDQPRGSVKAAGRAAPFLLAAALLPGSAVLALHFRDGPPARVTGGFGEDSCVACHSGQAANDPAGRLMIAGFPARFTPGESYEIEIALSRPNLAAAGFELAVRHAADQTQAGRLREMAGSEKRIGLLDDRGVQFAHHLEPDAARADDGTVRWQLTWTAPDATAPVVVHVAAVAANGDESELGDFVYTAELTSQSARSSSALLTRSCASAGGSRARSPNRRPAATRSAISKPT